MRELLADLRAYRGLTAEQVDSRAALAAGTCRLYEETPGDAPWVSVVARVALLLATPASELVSPTGRAAECVKGQCGPLLRAWRRARGFRPAEIANRCGLSVSAYLEIERGASTMELQAPELLHISEALDVPLYDLLTPA